MGLHELAGKRDADLLWRECRSCAAVGPPGHAKLGRSQVTAVKQEWVTFRELWGLWHLGMSPCPTASTCSQSQELLCPQNSQLPPLFLCWLGQREGKGNRTSGFLGLGLGSFASLMCLFQMLVNMGAPEFSNETERRSKSTKK